MIFSQIKMRGIGDYDREFLGKLDRAGLRRALWLMRRQDARPDESNPAAAQYDGLATASSVRAEYRRRGWALVQNPVFPSAFGTADGV